MAFRVEITAPQAGIDRVLKQLTRRQVARRLNAAGNESQRLAEQFANQELEPRYDESRRRRPGSPHYHNNFRVQYSGLSDLGGGLMLVEIRNSSPVAELIENGSPPHTISPRAGGRLSWPGTTLLPDQSVQHPGTGAHKIMEGAAKLALREQFPGLNPRVNS